FSWMMMTTCLIGFGGVAGRAAADGEAESDVVALLTVTAATHASTSVLITSMGPDIRQARGAAPARLSRSFRFSGYFFFACLVDWAAFAGSVTARGRPMLVSPRAN